MTSSRRTFEALCLLEGISFLLLLFVAMPLKYVAGIPVATRIIGLLHGLAFVAYELYVINTLGDRRWPTKTVALGAFCGFVPLGTFFFITHVRRIELEASRAPR